METYFSIPVDIKTFSQWFKKLRIALSKSNVNWQDGHFHITPAFIAAVPSDFDPAAMSFSRDQRLSIMLDRLKVFKSLSGDYVIAITSSQPTQELSEFIEGLREELRGNGCKVTPPDFNLHITLGRVSASNMSIEYLDKILRGVVLPSFPLSLNKLSYLQRDGHKIIKSWNI
jgi:2'-5' RNA ligase